MQVVSELGNLAPLLGDMARRRRADCERALRALHWGGLPVYAVGTAGTISAAAALGEAFEELVDCPVAVREAGQFLAGSLGALRSGALAILIGDETPELAEAAQAARKRNAKVMVIAREPGALAEAAHETFALPDVPGAAPAGLAAACVQHAAAGLLALVAARMFKRPDARLERVERDWAELPGHLERAVAQYSGAVRAAASELRACSPLLVVGGGHYRAAAQRVALLARREGGGAVIDLDPPGLVAGWIAEACAGRAALFFSGTRSRWRAAAAEAAARLNQCGAAVVAVTGGNDHELVRAARQTLLVPEMADLPGALLALAIGGWVAVEAGGTARLPRTAGKARSSSGRREASAVALKPAE